MNFLKFHNFISSLKSVSLDNDEKKSLRADFLMKAGLKHTNSPFSQFFIPTLHYAKIVAYSILLFLTGIVPFTFAAENAQPGDILYPLKEAVNEPVKETIKHIAYPIKFKSEQIKKDDDSHEKNKFEQQDDHKNINWRNSYSNESKNYRKDFHNIINIHPPVQTRDFYPTKVFNSTSTKISVPEKILDKTINEIGNNDLHTIKKVTEDIDKHNNIPEIKNEIEKKIKDTTNIIKNVDLSL